MCNVPLKFFHVCRLCLTVVSDSEIVKLSLFNNTNNTNNNTNNINNDNNNIKNEGYVGHNSCNNNNISVIINNTNCSNNKRNKNNNNNTKTNENFSVIVEAAAAATAISIPDNGGAQHEYKNDKFVTRNSDSDNNNDTTDDVVDRKDNIEIYDKNDDIIINTNAGINNTKIDMLEQISTFLKIQVCECFFFLFM